MGGYTSIYKQYSDYKYVISQYLTEYLEYKSFNMPAEQYGGWSAYAVRPDHFGRLAPFVLSETASVRVRKKLDAVAEKRRLPGFFCRSIICAGYFRLMRTSGLLLQRVFFGVYTPSFAIPMPLLTITAIQALLPLQV